MRDWKARRKITSNSLFKPPIPMERKSSSFIQFPVSEPPPAASESCIFCPSFFVKKIPVFGMIWPRSAESPPSPVIAPRSDIVCSSVHRSTTYGRPCTALERKSARCPRPNTWRTHCSFTSAASASTSTSRIEPLSAGFRYASSNVMDSRTKWSDGGENGRTAIGSRIASRKSVRCVELKQHDVSSTPAKGRAEKTWPRTSHNTPNAFASASSAESPCVSHSWANDGFDTKIAFVSASFDPGVLSTTRSTIVLWRR